MTQTNNPIQKKSQNTKIPTIPLSSPPSYDDVIRSQVGPFGSSSSYSNILNREVPEYRHTFTSRIIRKQP
ncbi:5809_t:CDS:1, partial [Dentiscutata heterogama]